MALWGRWSAASVLLGSVAVLAACSGEQTETSAEAPACDRACLIDLTDSYIAALVAHDAAGLPLSNGFAFVENAERMDVGEGLWASATGGATDFSIHVPDEAAQRAGWLGMIEKDGEPALIAIRLDLDNGQLVRAEHRVTTPFDGTEERFVTPRAGLVSEVPEEARLPRDELARIGASYYDAVDDNDGTLMPFAPDCQRQENGIITAGEGAGQGPASQDIPPLASDCAGQLSSGVMAYITTIENRDVFAADPVTGLAMGFSVLAHPMDFEPYPVTSADGTVTMFSVERLGYEPWDNVAAHVWKVGADGLVHEIEALGFSAPNPAPTGWEEEAQEAAE